MDTVCIFLCLLSIRNLKKMNVEMQLASLFPITRYFYPFLFGNYRA